MEWVVVEFLESEECKAVPVNWVLETEEESLCFYPPKSCIQRNLNIWLRTGKDPSDDWDTHVCRVFEKSRTGKYELATQLERECIDTSEIDACKPLGRGLRRKRRPERIVEHVEVLPSVHMMAHASESSSDEEVVSRKIQPPPPLPSEPRCEKGMLSRPNIPRAGTTTKLPVKEGRSIAAGNDSELAGETSGLSCKSKNCKKLVTSLQNMIDELSEKLLERDVAWEKRHIRLEEKINTLTSMAEMGNKILANHANITEVPSFIEKFPLSSIEEFAEMEELLVNNYSMYKALVTELARRSSGDEASFVYKLLYFLLKDSVAKEYSLTGKSGADGLTKKKFCDTKLYRAILDTGKRPNLAHIGIDKINKKIGEWLRQTGTRMKRSLGRCEFVFCEPV